MHQYLYRIQPVRPAMLVEGPTAQEAAVVGEHCRSLRDLLAQGVVLLAGRTLNTDPTAFGIVVFSAASETDALQIMRADPAVAQGHMSAELFPFRLVLGSGAALDAIVRQA